MLQGHWHMGCFVSGEKIFPYAVARPFRTILTSGALRPGALGAAILAATIGGSPSAKAEPLGSAQAFPPTRFALRVDATRDATLSGVEVDQPWLLNRRTAIVGQLYAAKGERELGVISAGLALRRSLSQNGPVAGVNAFFDGLRDVDGFSYARLGLGADLAWGQLTLRANGYLPLGHAEDRRVTVRERHGEELENNVLTTFDSTERTIFERSGASGWDAEAEWAFVSAPKFFDPRVAVGYYELRADHPAALQSGLRARAELRVGKHLITQVEWRQDSARLGQEWRAEVRLEYAFGKTAEREPARRVEPANDGKAVRLLDGKDDAPTSSDVIDPRLFEPVRRTVRPEVLSATRRTTTSHSRRTIISDPMQAPDPRNDCGCDSDSRPLVFQ
jgi:hypothetical protein